MEQMILYVKSFSILSRRTGEPFIRLVLLDEAKKELKGVIWDNVDSFVRVLQAGKAYGANVEMRTYNGEPQVVILDLIEVDESFDYSVFGLTSVVNVDELWEKLLKFVEEVKDSEYHQLLTRVLSDPFIEKRFKDVPATLESFYSYPGGLLHLVVTMLEVATVLPFAIDRDLLIALIILHDIGKLLEYEKVGFSFQRSLHGDLIGHVMLGIDLLRDVASVSLSSEKMLKLEHCIISHHYEEGFYSPTPPKILEGEVFMKLRALCVLPSIYASLSPDAKGWSTKKAPDGNKKYLA